MRQVFREARRRPAKPRWAELPARASFAATTPATAPASASPAATPTAGRGQGGLAQRTRGLLARLRLGGLRPAEIDRRADDEYDVSEAHPGEALVVPGPPARNGAGQGREEASRDAEAFSLEPQEPERQP